MEMMDRITIHAVEDFIHAGYDLDAAAIYYEADGMAEEVTEEIQRSARLCEKVAPSNKHLAE